MLSNKFNLSNGVYADGKVNGAEVAFMEYMTSTATDTNFTDFLRAIEVHQPRTQSELDNLAAEFDIDLDNLLNSQIRAINRALGYKY